MDETLKQQVDDIQRTLDAFLSEYYRNVSPTAQIFTKHVYFKGGVDLSGTPINIGQSGGSIGLYGVTAVTKAGSIAAPSTPSVAYSQGEAQSAVNAINSIRTALANIGITA